MRIPVLLSVSVLSLALTSVAQDKTIFERTKKTTVTIPLSGKNFTCEEGYNEYGWSETNLWLSWDYRPFTWLNAPESTPTMTWYSRDHRCHEFNSVWAEAAKNNGLITRELKSVLTEKIGSTWGGCKRYQEDWAYLQLTPKLDYPVRGFQFKVIEEFPLKVCLVDR